ncbi:MAG: hypothetical protein PHV54_04415 [Tolumonas sp.]|nr:hypothetical protein [Tolumonas sp.]
MSRSIRRLLKIAKYPADRMFKSDALRKLIIFIIRHFAEKSAALERDEKNPRLLVRIKPDWRLQRGIGILTLLGGKKWDIVELCRMNSQYSPAGRK